jgi:hypothetical protein
MSAMRRSQCPWISAGDNPPVGTFPCASNDQALVEYALAGIDSQLFVSKYQLHLPATVQLRRELEQTDIESTATLRFLRATAIGIMLC